MRIFNTLTRKIEEFKPLEGNVVKIYVCGPTVYDHSHIGHGRVYVFFDLLERYLRFKGYRVSKAINITDIDDKMINRSRELGITINELAERMTASFLEDIIGLNCLLPEYMPRATHHIGDMINIVKGLINKGYAYKSENGDIYFDVTKFREYGKLSKQSLSDLVAGKRVEPGEGKRNPADFALWKAWKPGEPSWDSPWGKGRPGWHIECSAMSMKHLGKTIDIHGGGSDLVFPHHENEIAQSEGYTGTRFVKYWMHVGLVTINNVEMSKSIGNVIPLKETIEKYGSDTLRIMYFTTHYRSPLEYSEEKIVEAKRIAERIRNTNMEINRMNIDELRGSNWIKKVEMYRRKIIEALDDDLNTPLAISIILSFIKWVNKTLSNRDLDIETYHEIKKLMDDIRYIFGLKLESPRQRMDMIDGLLKIIIDIRRRLREEKNYRLADEIREKLNELGIILEDRGLETIYRLK